MWSLYGVYVESTWSLQVHVGECKVLPFSDPHRLLCNCALHTPLHISPHVQQDWLWKGHNLLPDPPCDDNDKGNGPWIH